MPPSFPVKTVDLLCGEFANQITSIFPAPSDISEFFKAPEQKRHIWFAWLSSEALSSMKSEDVKEHLLFSKNVNLLKEAFGKAANGYVSVCNKLPVTALKANQYVALHQLLTEKSRRRKAILHCKFPDAQLIDKVFGLHPEICTEKILSLLPNSAYAVLTTEMCHRTLALSNGQEWQSLRIHLETCVTAADIPNELSNLLKEHQFWPAPPIADTVNAKALKSAEETEKAGIDFQNCLSRNSWWSEELFTGGAYYYQWQGAEPCIVEIRKDKFWGWYIREIRGPKNCEVSNETVSQIISELNLAPVASRHHLWSPRDIFPSGLDLIDNGPHDRAHQSAHFAQQNVQKIIQQALLDAPATTSIPKSRKKSNQAQGEN